MGQKMSTDRELVANLHLMVNNPTNSDVVFVCDDGKRVHASRSSLAGRSEMLKGMLFSGMAEGSLSEIKLPTISSPVFLCVLEFLYTGTLSNYSLSSWTMACEMAQEIISASRFFLLPNLDQMTRKHVQKLLSDDLPAAASLLTEAMESKAVCDETDSSLEEQLVTILGSKWSEPSYIKEQLVTILSSKWSEPSYIQYLSEDAFYYLLATSKGKYENDDQLSFDEYLRFRQVLRWWVWQSDLPEDYLDTISPDEKLALLIYRNLRYINKRLFTSMQRLSRDSLNSVARLLSNIDFQRIHHVILATVVEPLNMNIVSLMDFKIFYRRHILRKSSKSLQCVVWDHEQSYTTSAQGYIIFKSGTGSGLAILMVPMSCSYAVYRWSFYVEEMPSPFCQFGLKPKRSRDLEDSKLAHQFTHMVLKCSPEKGARIHLGNADGYRQCKELGPSLLSLGSVLVFTFNAHDRTCSLFLGGIKASKDYGIVWDQIPRGVTYYPAVCLGTSDKGRMRVEFSSGFDLR